MGCRISRSVLLVGLLQTQVSIVVACHNGSMCKHTHKCVSCHRIVWANCERQTIDAPHQMFFAMQRKDSADKQSETLGGHAQGCLPEGLW